MKIVKGALKIKRKRSKKKESVQEARLKLLAITVGFLGFIFTGEIVTGIILGIASIFVAAGWQLYRHLAYQKQLAKANISEIDTFDGVQFEYYLKALFKSLGFNVQMTATTGDFGADLILKRNDKKIVVQAKRYSKSVGIKAVQEVISAVKLYEANEAWVVTNSTFTKAAVELAKVNDVILVDRDKLVELINQEKIGLVQQPDPIEVKRSIKAEIKDKCEECGSTMVLRNSKNGVFMGCSQYPSCTFTKKG